MTTNEIELYCKRFVALGILIIGIGLWNWTGTSKLSSVFPTRGCRYGLLGLSRQHAPADGELRSVCAATLTKPRVRPVSSHRSLTVTGAKKAIIFIRQAVVGRKALPSTPAKRLYEFGPFRLDPAEYIRDRAPLVSTTTGYNRGRRAPGSS